MRPFKFFDFSNAIFNLLLIVSSGSPCNSGKSISNCFTLKCSLKISFNSFNLFLLLLTKFIFYYFDFIDKYFN